MVLAGTSRKLKIYLANADVRQEVVYLAAAMMGIIDYLHIPKGGNL